MHPVRAVGRWWTVALIDWSDQSSQDHRLNKDWKQAIVSSVHSVGLPMAAPYSHTYIPQRYGFYNLFTRSWPWNQSWQQMFLIFLFVLIKNNWFSCNLLSKQIELIPRPIPEKKGLILRLMRCYLSNYVHSFLFQAQISLYSVVIACEENVRPWATNHFSFPTFLMIHYVSGH